MQKINFTKGELITKIMLSALVVGIFCFFVFCQNLILASFGYEPYKTAMKNDFQICFVDVGQGDATFIKYKDTSFLIDCGNSFYAENTAQKIEKLNGENNLDFLLLTHADTDHTGGAEKIFEKFDVDNFLRPKITTSQEVEKIGNENNYQVYDTSAYSLAISSFYREKDCKNVFVEKGVVFSNSEFCFEILSPISDKDLSIEDTNSYSSVVKVTYKESTYLLMADCDKKMEKKFVEVYGEKLKCDILKVSHHGSNNGTCEELLNVARPKFAIASVGEVGLKEYGHCGEDFCLRLEKYGVAKLQTSEKGSIMFSGHNGEKIICFKVISTLSIPATSVVCVVLVLLIWAFRPQKNKKS